MVSTHLKNISQNGNLPPSRGENKQYLKPPPSLNKNPSPTYWGLFFFERGIRYTSLLFGPTFSYLKKKHHAPLRWCSAPSCLCLSSFRSDLCLACDPCPNEGWHSTKISRSWNLGISSIALEKNTFYEKKLSPGQKFAHNNLLHASFGTKHI